MRFIPSKYQLLVIVLLLAIGGLQYDLWMSSSGIKATIELNQHVAKFVEENEVAANRNEELYDEVVSLRNNNEVIEGLARQDLGLIQKGETFFQLLKAPPASQDNQ